MANSGDSGGGGGGGGGLVLLSQNKPSTRKKERIKESSITDLDPEFHVVNVPLPPPSSRG